MTVRELELALDAFEGPFDLLLTLVLKEELELVDVDVAEIVLAFCAERLTAGEVAALGGDGARGSVSSSPAEAGLSPGATPRARQLGATEPKATGAGARGGTLGSPALDLEASGEFLVLVAALLELKARLLFPDSEADGLEDLDPEEAAEELARRLAEYRRMKDAAGWLGQRLDDERDRYFRLGPAPLAQRQLDPQDPARLADALRGLAAEPPQPSTEHLALRFPPVSLFLARFRAVLARRRRFDFDQEVAALSRIEQAVAFLALLELRKSDEVEVAQARPFAPIRVTREGRAAWSNARFA